MSGPQQSSFAGFHDVELCSFAAAGERRAFGELVRRHASAVRHLLRRMGAQAAEADDVVGPLFKAAKPNKAGDRTIRVTWAESEALAAVATALEGSGGALAYSARTLRGRLDAAWDA